MCELCELTESKESENGYASHLVEWEVGLGRYVQLEIVGNTLFIKFEGFSEEIENADLQITINYCPFCGALLRPLFADTVKTPCEWCSATEDGANSYVWEHNDMSVTLFIGERDNEKMLFIKMDNIISGIPTAACGCPIKFCPICGKEM